LLELLELPNIIGCRKKSVLKRHFLDIVRALKIRKVTPPVPRQRKFRDNIADLVGRRARISYCLRSLRRDRGRGKEKHQGTTRAQTLILMMILQKMKYLPL
jgi:hypothetical protein